MKVEDIFKIKILKFYYKYSQAHYRFISMKCSPKLLIDTIMELDNNRLKLFINIQLEPIWTEMHKTFVTGNSQ